MKNRETNWEKVLGGYATGTLTDEERELLMQAALRDQALFDALMDEESLRETLADPATRAALLMALEPPVKTVAWWRNPWPWTGLGAVAAAVALFVILRPAAPPQAVQMAQNRPAAVAPEPVPAVIETPKQLIASSPETDRKVTAPLRDSIAPPPTPPALTITRQAVENSEMAPARANAPPAPAPAADAQPAFASTAKKKEALEERTVEPIAVTLAYQAFDGAWRSLDLQAAIPASRPLRLNITSVQSGRLSFQPPIVEACNLLAGVPAEIALPAQPVGPLHLRLALVLSGAQSFGRVSALREEPKASKTRAMTAADSAYSAPAPVLFREINLRIE